LKRLWRTTATTETQKQVKLFGQVGSSLRKYSSTHALTYKKGISGFLKWNINLENGIVSCNFFIDIRWYKIIFIGNSAHNW